VNRRGVGVLATVVMLSFAAGLIVLAYHSLWRSSSRNLFSVQEDRNLMNLCRSATAEAMYRVQTQLEQGSSKWFDFCTQEEDPSDEPVQIESTRAHTEGMAADPRFLRYTITPVLAKRVKGLSYDTGMGGMVGVVDFTVTATVERSAPAHSAKLTLTQRHAFWFSDAPTPFQGASRHIEIIPTAAATFLKVD
jgi:hypothetical protein